MHDIAVPPLPAGHTAGGGALRRPDQHSAGVAGAGRAAGVARAGRRQARSILRWFVAAVALLFGICALTLGLFFARASAMRWTSCPHWCCWRWLASSDWSARWLGLGRLWRRAARWGWGLLLGFSVAFNLLASYERRTVVQIDLGNAFFARGRMEEALACFQNALRIQPDNATGHKWLGDSLLQKGQADEAITHYREALEIEPNDVEVRSNLGFALFQKGRVDEAMAHFQPALKIEPDSANVHNNLGFALLRKGRVEEAIAHYQRALEIAPDFPGVHHNLGSALVRKGQLDEAVVQLQKALEIEPNSADVHNDLGFALYRKKQADEAIAHFWKALEIRPGYEAACNNLVRVAWMLATSPEASVRNGARAIDLVQRVERLTGDRNPAIIGTLAAAYAEGGQFAEAMATVSERAAPGRCPKRRRSGQHPPGAAQMLSGRLSIPRPRLNGCAGSSRPAVTRTLIQ